MQLVRKAMETSKTDLRQEELSEDTDTDTEEDDEEQEEEDQKKEVEVIEWVDTSFIKEQLRKESYWNDKQ